MKKKKKGQYDGSTLIGCLFIFSDGKLSRGAIFSDRIFLEASDHIHYKSF